MADTETGSAATGRAPLGFGALATQLPALDWTLWRLTGVWAKDGEMLRCPLPGHDDSTPSFNIWDADDDGVPQRFGCFGCGRRGDVVQLIEELEALSEADALKRASELFEEEQNDDSPHERSPKQEPDDDVDLDSLLQEYYTKLDARRLADFQRYMRSKGLDGEELEQYAMDVWGWTATGDGAVAVPHRTADGKLTGIKYRRVDGKASQRGSHYTALYGSWRDRGKGPVLLCEGESDALWAAWSLRDADVTVLALPSGAQQFREDWFPQLQGRELTLAFDSDEEGMTAARRWLQARPDALLARLPEEEDLLSCGIPVAELMEFAKQPRKSMGLIEIDDGVLAKKTQQGSVPVADFSFKPVRELYTDDGPAWEVEIAGSRGTSLMRGSDLHSVATMTRWSNRNGGAWFGGHGAVTQGVFNWLMSESAMLPLERATTRAGRVGRSFVGPSFCIGADRLRYIPPTAGDAKLDSKLSIVKAEWDGSALLDLETLNDPAVMATVLGWLCASLLRGEHPPAPPLFVAGESGAGKTNLLATLLGSFGFRTETNLTTTTPYGVDCMVNSSIGFPIWFDEYRVGARADSMERLRQLLRDAYYGQPSMKGGMTERATELTEVKTWAGIVVSGEMSSHETSHRDRMVMLDLDPKHRNRESYSRLQDRRRTVGLGYSLLEFLARRPTQLFRIVPQGPVDQPDRFRDALGFVQAGWEAWKAFRWEVGLRDTPVGPDFVSLSEDRSEVQDPWLEALKACEGVEVRGSSDVIVQQTSEGVELLAGEVIVEARRLGIELPARSNELVSWLKRRHTVVDKRTANGRRAKLVKSMEL